MILLILCILVILNVTASTKHVWLIRHCDKPNDKESSCCSSYGYKHANNWYKYFEKYITSSPYIYGANYNEEYQCTEYHNYNYDRNCQKSQRMYLTAYAIHESFYYSKNEVNIDYCTGQYKELSKSVSNINNDNVIVVWEHSEIIDIINYFGINVNKWPNNLDDEYNIVFMIDVDSSKLYYDCYQWEADYTYCSNDIIKWLNKYTKISDYYEKKNYKNYTLTTSNALLPNFYQKHISIFNIFFIVIINIILICFFLFFKKQYDVRNYMGRKYKYVVIPETQFLKTNSIYVPSYSSTNNSHI